MNIKNQSQDIANSIDQPESRRKSVQLSKNPLTSAQFPKSFLLSDLFLAIDATKRKSQTNGENHDGNRQVTIEWKGGLLTFIGPPLTTQHEDILIGLIQLLSDNVPSLLVDKERLAEYEKLPAVERRKQLDFFDPATSFINNLVSLDSGTKISTARVSKYNSGADEDAEFSEELDGTKLTGTLSLGHLLTYLNKSDGSLSYKEHASALEDLYNTKVYFKFGNNYPVEQRLLELRGERLTAAADHDGNKLYRFKYEFKGLMRALLAEYAVIDFSVRSKLSPMGKLFHRQMAYYNLPRNKNEFVLLESDLKRMMNKEYWSQAIAPLKTKGNKPGQLDILKCDNFIVDYLIVERKSQYGEKALILNPASRDTLRP